MLKNERILKKKSYRKFLVVTIVLVVLVPLIINSSVILWLNSRTLGDSIKQTNLERANTISHEIDRLLLETEHLMQTLSQDEGLTKMDAGDMEILKTTVSNSTVVSQIYVMNLSGMQIYKTSGDLGDRSDRRYFQEAKNGNKCYDMIYSSTTGKATAVLALPIKRNEKVVGVIGASIDLEILTTLIERFNENGESYAFIVDAEGIVLAHPNTAYVENMENFSDYDFVKDVLSGKAASELTNYESQRSIVAYSPVGTSGWGVVVQSPVSIAFQALDKTRWYSMISVLVWVLISIGLGSILSRTIFKNIAYLESAVSKLASGDLSIKIEEQYLNRRDEFGTLSQKLQVLIDEYKELLTRLTTDMNYIDEFTTTLHEISGENAKATEEMTEQIVELSERVNEDLNSTKGTFETLQGVTDGASLVATNTETLNETIKFNLEETDKSFRMIQDTVNEMHHVVTTSEVTNVKMGALKTSANDIGGISEVIKSISEQTNLLALNASIEAARAGEAGRGFAVVADEIRKLAEQSNDSANKITDIITTIQNEIEEIYVQFESMVRGIRTTAEKSESAKSSMGEVIEISNKSNIAVEEIAAVSEEQAASMTEVNDSMERFEKTLVNTNEMTTHISAIAQEQMASTEQILNMIDELRTLAANLVEKASKFKLS